MAEYINKQALLAEYDRVHVGPPGGARKLIEEAPAADVQTVVHGRWERCGRYLCECQDCGEIYSTHENLGKGWNYCPNFGAHMKDGE